MVSNIDYNLGILLNKLEELNLDKNTLVIFINDNGATFGSDIYNANMRGVKTTAWYGGTRAFSFWRWPEKIIPKDIDALTAHVDILPTLAEIVHAKIPKETKKELDGRSLVPLLKSKKTVWKDRILFTHVGRWNDGAIDEHKYCQCAIRWNNYNMVRVETCNDPNCRGECKVINRVQNGGKGYYSKINGDFHYAITPKGKWALYDLKTDISQKNNIALDNPKIVKRLELEYEKWWKEVYQSLK